jgi:hypothetical protein
MIACDLYVVGFSDLKADDMWNLDVCKISFST